MKIPQFRFPQVEVIWDDAESESGWTEVPQMPLTPTLMLTIGFLIVDAADHILVADTYEIAPNSRTISNTTKIPRGMIKEIHPVKITRIKKKAPKHNGNDSGLVHSSNSGVV